MNTLVRFINAMEVREDDETYKNGVDLLFDKLKNRDPDHFAVRQYAKYRLAAGVISSKRCFNQTPNKRGSHYVCGTNGRTLSHGEPPERRALWNLIMYRRAIICYPRSNSATRRTRRLSGVTAKCGGRS
ncbi:hypothetical protein FACS1894219_06110 [Clostridia bacterium]|nr:hypothetical protein FACS1894219_06110 [Clostridia bacterium]